MPPAVWVKSKITLATSVCLDFVIGKHARCKRKSPNGPSDTWMRLVSLDWTRCGLLTDHCDRECDF